jgi:dTDP-4-dehydrorhamnose reductase
MKNVLVTGSSGQLGQSIAAISSTRKDCNFTFINTEQLDLSQLDAIEDYFLKHQFDYIINCAAYTAVDNAESDSELADKINHLAVEKLAFIAKQTKTVFIHISTDYVFNGEAFRPYIETDLTDPQCMYGISKLKGEQAVQTINPDGIIIRTSWVYSEYGNNFVKTMLRLGKEREQLSIIYDQVGTPTYAQDLARVCLELLDVKHQGIKLYHFANEGVCSWYDFAKTIFTLAEIQCDIQPIEAKDYPTPAKRPHYSVLNKTKIKQDMNIKIPYWKDSLQTCLEKLTEN